MQRLLRLQTQQNAWKLSKKSDKFRNTLLLSSSERKTCLAKVGVPIAGALSKTSMKFFLPTLKVKFLCALSTVNPGKGIIITHTSRAIYSRSEVSPQFSWSEMVRLSWGLIQTKTLKTMNFYSQLQDMNDLTLSVFISNLS